MSGFVLAGILLAVYQAGRKKRLNRKLQENATACKSAPVIDWNGK
jgi:hypothetical protein